MATALPIYHAAVNWPRYTFVYFNDVDHSAYQNWAKRHLEYFARRPGPRRMPSGIQMRISIRATSGRHGDEFILNNVVKDSRSRVSLIARDKAIATRGELLDSPDPRDPRRQIRLRIRRPSCAKSETETFVIVDTCPDGHDAVLRHDLNLEQDSGVHPIGLDHRNKTEREEQKRRDEEAKARRRAEKEAEDRQFKEDARQRKQHQQSQESGYGQVSQGSPGAGQQQQSRHADQGRTGTNGRHAP